MVHNPATEPRSVTPNKQIAEPMKFIEHLKMLFMSAFQATSDENLQATSIDDSEETITTLSDGEPSTEKLGRHLIDSFETDVDDPNTFVARTRFDPTAPILSNSAAWDMIEAEPKEYQSVVKKRLERYRGKAIPERQ